MAAPSSVTKVRTDLAYYGVVTRVISNTQFTAAGLAGLGNGALVGYAAYVLAKADGTITPPHAEQPAVTAYVSSSGTFTHVAYTAPLAVGDQLLLLHPNISTGLTAAVAALVALQASIGPAATSFLGNIYNILGNPAVSISTTLATILASVGPGAQGLCYYGVVTGVPGVNQFEIATLAGLGDAKFIDLAGVYPYYAFVLRDASGPGAAPQGEARPITNYGTATGGFTTNAFTVPVAIGDEILIVHPFLARIMNLYGLPPVTGSTVGNWQAAETDIVSLGAANVKYKLHSLILDINALVGTITIRLYMQIAGVERRVYQQTFTVAADGPGLWIVNGTIGIHEVLRVTAQSNNAADNGQAIAYDYLLEAM